MKQIKVRSDVTTGWPAGMLQDDCRGLSQRLAADPGARLHIRDAVLAIDAQNKLTNNVGMHTIDDQAAHRLDKFLDNMRTLNYRFAMSGLNYRKDPDYQRELKELKQNFLVALKRIFG
ncbi:MAG: hypothetical protein V4493_01120 [Pseudomonadota bacterium]